MNNRLTQYRKKFGLTQRALARKAGTSQPTVQRLEAGTIPVRLEVAQKLAVALETTVDYLFPECKAPTPPRELPAVTSHALHTVKLRLRRHAEAFHYRVDNETKERLWLAFQHKQQGFLVFDSDKLAIAVNLAEVLFVHFLFDPPFTSLSEEDDKAGGVRMFFVGDNWPQAFEVEGDTADYNSDDIPDDADCQMQEVLSILESTPPEDATEVCKFEDIDGETVFFDVGKLALLEIVIDLVRPGHIPVEVAAAPADALPEGVTVN